MASDSLLDALKSIIREIVREELRTAGAVASQPDPRGYRLSKGMELAQLENESGVAHSTLSRLENGKIRKPEPATLNRIAAALGVDAEQYRTSVAILINRKSAA